MYLAVALREQGFNLQRKGGEGPEFFASIGKNRIWFEAIAPTSGEGVDKVPEIIFGECNLVPTDKIILRFTNALDVKKERYHNALKKGIVKSEDRYVLAINFFGIQNLAGDDLIPLAAQAFLNEAVPAIAVDCSTGEQVDSCSQYRPEVVKRSGERVSTKSFLGKDTSFCSAVISSTVYPANRQGAPGWDFSILHNPNAVPVSMDLFAWCTQWSYREGKLAKHID